MRSARFRSGRSRARCGQSGLSMIELLVGFVVGLVIVGGAMLLFVNHLRGNRHLAEEARLTQDLRTASDLVASQLRRAGYWDGALSGVVADGPASNPHGPIELAGDAEASRLDYSFSRNAVIAAHVPPSGSGAAAAPPEDRVGWRLSSGALQMKLGQGYWQTLTDAETLRVTHFAVNPGHHEVPLGAFCPGSCSAANGCPSMRVRHFDVLIRAQSTGPSALTREVRDAVRVRNDEFLAGACE